MDPLLDARQVQRLLNCSRPMIYKLVRQGKLPAVRIGTAVRFRETAVTEFVDRSEAQPGGVGA